ncbi:MAG: dCMP deaminase family protein [Lachnospiraceae bacterium]|nr:dCMP deaminase family protein [Lachnospiraceae bacterium]
MRRDKINYYLDLAEVVLARSTCIRRRYGAVIVKNDTVISTGYNGAPRGRANCTDLGVCLRESLGVARGERYELCRSVHAEANAIIAASREEMLGSSLFLTGIEASTGQYTEDTDCCAMCKRLVINAGISIVYARIDRDRYRIIHVDEAWVSGDETLPTLSDDATP